MVATLLSPNTDNFVVGKGKVYFKPDGAAGDILTNWRVGNVTEFEFGPALEKLDHFDQQEGVRSKDKTVVLEKAATVRMVMEEWTPNNLGIYLLGTPDISDLSAVTIDIFAGNSVRGELRFVGENEIGPKWTYIFPAVEFSPEGTLQLISEEWAPIEVSGEVLRTGDPLSFGTASADFSGGVAPANIVLPAISGLVEVGETLTAFRGTWSGSPASYAYQWQTDDGGGFDPIPGATGPTYLIGALTGQPIKLQVTATNGAGSTAALSSPTVDVVA